MGEKDSQKRRDPSSTPMMRQYQAIKAQYPDAILLFRLGDFYEMFFHDAEVAAPILNITLTARNGMPMCGIPYHALDSYLSKLVEGGLKVAICDQVEDPSHAKGVVKREVVRVVIPGTLLESGTQEKELTSALVEDRGGFGMAFLDLASGEFFLTEVGNLEEATACIERLAPLSLLVPYGYDDSTVVNRLKRELPRLFVDTVDPWVFEVQGAKRLLLEHFKVQSLKGFGCESSLMGIRAAGALVHYLSTLQRRSLSHVRSLHYYAPRGCLYLDPVAIRHLELTENLWDRGRDGTLLRHMDHTLTPMGTRMLKHWMLHPSLQVNEINQRQDVVEWLVKNRGELLNLREELKSVYDIERLGSRVAMGMATPRVLGAIRDSLKTLPKLKAILESCPAQLAKKTANEIDTMPQLESLLQDSLVENPPARLGEGWTIREGHNPGLDHLKRLSAEGSKLLKELEERERESLGIPSLKVKYNRVFGHFIEVTRPHLSKVPPHYIRRQTLSNAERFTTQELKEIENSLLNAQEEAARIEAEIFSRLVEETRMAVPRLQKTSRAIAICDVMASFAHLALRMGYARPTVTEGYEIAIREGRHPIVAEVLKEEFIPNSTRLSRDQRFHIITGPNMSGKSTYIRQVALLVVMAQMGSFIPASQATMGLVDRIFTRVGSGDNLAKGESTFMVEMTETANIIHNATDKSLVILDEIGRGTSTYDGLALAWAVSEHLHHKVKAKVLFATHYHELTELEGLLPHAKNYNVVARETREGISFLHKVEEGAADKSYGVQVAQIAGLPQEVIERARELLERLERRGKQPTTAEAMDTRFKKVLTEIQSLNLARLSPLEAVAKIRAWQKVVRG